MTDIGINTGDANTVGWVPESNQDRQYILGKNTAQQIGTMIEQIEQAAIADGGVIKLDSSAHRQLEQLKLLVTEYTMNSTPESSNPGQINVNARSVIAESQRVIGKILDDLNDGYTVSVAQLGDLLGIQWSLDTGLFANNSQITNSNLKFRDPPVTTPPNSGNSSSSNVDTTPVVTLPEQNPPAGDTVIDQAQALLRDAISAESFEAKTTLFEEAMALLDGGEVVGAPVPAPTPPPDQQPVPLPEPIVTPDATVPQQNWDNLQSLEYIASYADLMDAYNIDAGQAEVHYNSTGNDEGRRISFSAAEYVAANVDLQEAFGDDLVAATKHYITTGRYEGRVLSPGDAPQPETVMVPVGQYFSRDTLMGVLSTTDDRGLTIGRGEGTKDNWGIGFTDSGEIDNTAEVTFDSGQSYDHGVVTLADLHGNEGGVQETATVRAYKDGVMVWEKEIRGDSDGIQTFAVDAAFDKLVFSTENASDSSDFSILEVQGFNMEPQTVAPDTGETPADPPAVDDPDTTDPVEQPDDGDGDTDVILSEEMTRFLAEMEILQEITQQSGLSALNNKVMDVVSLALETSRETSEDGRGTSDAEFDQLRSAVAGLYADIVPVSDQLTDPDAAIDALSKALIQLTNVMAGDDT